MAPEVITGRHNKSFNASLQEKDLANQQIMNEIWRIYFDSPPLISSEVQTSKQLPKLTLSSIAKRLKTQLPYVSTKATVLIIGNISSGKSTFINWYANYNVQKTGMAIETNGFTLVTGGKVMNELGGNSTVMLNPYFKEIAEGNKGLLENLSTKTCPAISGRLNLINFIDSPGIMDGTIPHAFDVENVIYEIAHFVDLILVFFEPVGQALGGRLLSVVEEIQAEFPGKIRFCLSKIDDVPTEEERIKIFCQVTQSLSTKISAMHGFDLIPIFIPGAKTGTYLSDSSIITNMDRHKEILPREKNGTANRISDVLSEIDRCVEKKVQDTVKGLKDDCNKLLEVAKSLYATDCNGRYNVNTKITAKKNFFREVQFFAALSLIILIALHNFDFVASFLHLEILDFISNGKLSSIILRKNAKYASSLLLNLPLGASTCYAILLSIVIFATLLRTVFQPMDVLPENEVEALKDDIYFIESVLKRWKIMNHAYIENQELPEEL